MVLLRALHFTLSLPCSFSLPSHFSLLSLSLSLFSLSPSLQDLVSSFRTMLTHISELLTADNASSLAYIHGLPVPPSGSAPHRPLDVLMELEKRGVFSHENVEPLIGQLTDLHRVDIINTCAIREYRERAEQASK